MYLGRLAVVVALGAALAGCAAGDGADSAAEAEPQTVRVLVLDGNLRRLGDSCAGAGAFRHVHPEAEYVVEDEDGDEVASGRLPDGTAEKIMDVDFREDMRQPTMCVMVLEITGMTELDGHVLVIDGHSALPIETSDDDSVAGEVVVS